MKRVTHCGVALVDTDRCVPGVENMRSPMGMTATTPRKEGQEVTSSRPEAKPNILTRSSLRQDIDSWEGFKLWKRGDGTAEGRQQDRRTHSSVTPAYGWFGSRLSKHARQHLLRKLAASFYYCFTDCFSKTLPPFVCAEPPQPRTTLVLLVSRKQNDRRQRTVPRTQDIRAALEGSCSPIACNLISDVIVHILRWFRGGCFLT